MADMWSAIGEHNKHVFAVFGANLTVSKEIRHRSTRKVEAASTIKLLVMAYLMRQAQDGEFSLNDPWQALPEDNKGGSGVLQFAPPRLPVEITQLCLWMMSVSDNFAANALLRRLGGKVAINAFAQKIGLNDTELLMSPIDLAAQRGKEISIGVTTAADMGRLLAMLLRGELLDPHYTEIALNMLESNQHSYLMRGIDPRPLKRLGSKTGTLPHTHQRYIVLNDCTAVVDPEGDKLVLCVFSQQPNTGPLPLSQDAPPRLELVAVITRLYQALRM